MSSVSQVFFGRFYKSEDEIVLLRSNEVIELYSTNNGTYQLITKYEVKTAKISKMIVVKKPGANKDMVVFEIP